MKNPNDLPPNTDAPDPIGKLLDTFETRMRNVFGDLKQNILAREWDHEFRPAPDPMWIGERWPFAESPGDLARRLCHSYWSSERDDPESEAAFLRALRTVLIEQPPRLAPWLDPGAAAKDSARLNLIEIALRHAFALFRPGGADIAPHAILALGKSYDVLDAASRASTPSEGLPVLKVKDGDEWRCYDELCWRDDGVLYARLAPCVADAIDLRGKPEPSSPLVRDDLSMRLKAFLACEKDLSAYDRSLIEEAAGELALTPKPKRSSGAQREAAFEAIRDGLLATNIRAGDRLVAGLISHNEYARIASAVADAVVGAEQ